MPRLLTYFALESVFRGLRKSLISFSSFRNVIEANNLLYSICSMVKCLLLISPILTDYLAISINVLWCKLIGSSGKKCFYRFSLFSRVRDIRTSTRTFLFNIMLKFWLQEDQSCPCKSTPVFRTNYYWPCTIENKNILSTDWSLNLVVVFATGFTSVALLAFMTVLCTWFAILVCLNEYS